MSSERHMLVIIMEAKLQLLREFLVLKRGHCVVFIMLV